MPRRIASVLTAAPGAARLGRLLDRRLSRAGVPEAAPIELTRRHIYMLPSRSGLVFALALLVMLIASINYDLGLGYGLVFVLFGTGTASTLHAYRNISGLRLRPGRCDPVFAGDTACLRIVVDNPRAARRPALRIMLRDAQAGFGLGAGETLSVELACATSRRGRLWAGRTVLETRWPLGLVRAWSVFVPDLSCVVHPAPEKNAPPLPGTSAAEGSGAPSAGTGDDDFAGLRPHQRADSPRHVAWKVFARGGPLMTKQFAGQQGRELALDWASLPSRLDVEQRLSRLSAWLLEAARSGRPYSLTLPATRVARGSGRDHLYRCLDALAHHGEADET
ncbi:DUF58 domain-containing protein [Thauera linaloolentis]|nr:DUF58 domain-containing protein [Thauera linaloolentis]MCM8564771.1 DUF58 domain-containing protein [Thauera linaloolentis]